MYLRTPTIESSSIVIAPFRRLLCIGLPEFRESGNGVGAELARDLPDVVPEPIFDIPWLVEALRH